MKKIVFCLLLSCLAVTYGQKKNGRGLKLKSDSASVEFGAKGDVAIRRRPDGSLGVDSKYLRVRDFMIGDVLIDDYIEKIIRKRIVPHIQNCKPGFSGTFCDQRTGGSNNGGSNNAGDKTLGGPNSGTAKNLKACWGECDADSQCAKGLKCFQRSKGEKIPGCKGNGGGKDWDYCYNPKGSNNGGSTSGSKQLGGGNSGTAKNLKACFGECDKDSQCAKGLLCFQRSKGEKIPGCHGPGGGKGWDYCYDPRHGGIKVLGGPNNSNAKNLERCFGECDNDSHCRYGLKCFQRSNGEPIPGCKGKGGGKDWDYCYDPNWKQLVTTKKPLGSKQLGGGNNGSAKNLKACFGECDSHSQCTAGLKCFQRSKGEKIPGCHGAGGGKDWDYCYDPTTGGVKVLAGPNNANAKNLGRCYGECDNDKHCAYGLKCFQRSNGEAIPGCKGAGGGKDWDYCYDPNWNEVVGGNNVLGGPNNGKAKNLKACRGECDADSQCAKGLKCFQRSNGEKIPGCTGPGGGKDWDYCYKPKGSNNGGSNNGGSNNAGDITLGGGNSGNAKNLKACRGECDADSQCAKGLKCFQRSNGEKIPGCKGKGGGKDWDYCYNPKGSNNGGSNNAGDITLGGGNNGKAKNLKACRGECDADSQCASGLKCFQRSKGEKIPGCKGNGGGRDWDYCYDPNQSGGRQLRRA